MQLGTAVAVTGAFMLELSNALLPKALHHYACFTPLRTKHMQRVMWGFMVYLMLCLHIFFTFCLDVMNVSYASIRMIRVNLKMTYSGCHATLNLLNVFGIIET